MSDLQIPISLIGLTLIDAGLIYAAIKNEGVNIYLGAFTGFLTLVVVVTWLIMISQPGLAS